jgi:serine protease Do
VDPEGPAAAAGIKSDDVITALNGNRILTASQLEANVSSQPPGTVATLRVRRGEDRLEVPVKTGEELDELHNLADTLDPVVNTISQLGVVGLDIAGPVLKIIPDLRRPEGVMVAVRNPETPYSGRPLQVGDAIYEINRRVIANVAEARKVLDRMKPGDPVVLLIEREGHLLYVPLELN